MAKLRIPQAMEWKYGAKCSKTADGTYIEKWVHNTLPKPTLAQMTIDVAEYEIWKANDDVEKAQAGQDLEDELNKPAGNPFKILKALRRLGKI